MPALQQADDKAPGRLDRTRPVAIIDIGSNSVRLVIYEGLSRAPTPLYNEKLLCGLGRGVAMTKRLPEDAVERALEALARFTILCRLADVRSVRVLATAAARDAENGRAFLAAAERACGFPIELLTGEREAALSASGVLSGFHRPDGVVGDLGGGSLELVDIGAAGVGAGMTLPLGGLVLRDLAEQSPKKAGRLARDALALAPQLGGLAGRTFYAVGGTWRALAKLQMAERQYPLRVLHSYEFDLADSFAKLVDRASPSAFKGADSISEARRPLLVYGAIVLDEIVRSGAPGRVTVSALGVREGLLYDDLGAEERGEDALISAAAELNLLRSRAPRHGHDLVAWTDAFMTSLGIDESPDERRLRHAACLLSDNAWRAHPDYRGEQSLSLIANAVFLAIDHPGRAYLALAVYFRHVGLSLDKVSPILATLATPRLLMLARLLAALLRIAYPVSIAMGGVLPRTPLLASGGRIVLRIATPLAPLASERLENRLRGLGRVLDRETRIEIE